MTRTLHLLAFGVAVAVTPMSSWAMLPSSCIVFRHLVAMEGLRSIDGAEAETVWVSRLEDDAIGGGSLYLRVSREPAGAADEVVTHAYVPVEKGQVAGDFAYLGPRAPVDGDGGPWWRATLAAVRGHVFEGAPLDWQPEDGGEPAALAGETLTGKVTEDRSGVRNSARLACTLPM